MDNYIYIIYAIIVGLSIWMYKVIYSLFFSPLSQIPSSLIDQMFPIILEIYGMLGKDHIRIKELHDKYGHTVRLGWNTVSFSTQEASKTIYSTYGFKKSTFYDAIQIVGENIFTTRKREFHSNRKKMLASSFSDQAILKLEYLVKKNADLLVDKITQISKDNQVFDLGIYFNYFTFDVIGDVAYGKSFDMLKKGYHPIIKWIKDIFIHSNTVYMFPFLKFYQIDSVKQVYKFSYETIQQSKQFNGRDTILNNILNATDKQTGEKLSEKEIVEESIVQLIAGTDTTSNSLFWTFYLLLQNPKVYHKLKQEINNIFPNQTPITYNKCKTECHYLSAVIYESLRQLPVAAGNPERITPKGGKLIDGYFIPENTIVGVNILSLHTSEKLWDNPNEFRPERWIINNKFQSKDNFMPFLIGPRACIGRNLAWMELFLATASLIKKFDFERVDKKEIKAYSFVVLTPEAPLNVKAKLT